MNAIAVGWRVVGLGGDALTPTVRSRLIQSILISTTCRRTSRARGSMESFTAFPGRRFRWRMPGKKKISADVFFQVIFPSLASLAVEFAMPL